MRRKGLPWPGGGLTVVVILLLVGGWLAGRRLLAPSAPASPAPETKETPETTETRQTFRQWLWGTRSLDLAVQVGIIFVGALGIAALLPSSDEDPPEEVPLGESPLALDGAGRDGERSMDGLENAAQGESDDPF